MNIIQTSLPGVMIIKPKVHGDGRGYFMETFHKERYAELGLDVAFVQDNLSLSHKGVLRGLHYQLADPQAKLVQAIQGAIYDVVVDVRKGSPTFGQWVGVELNGEKLHQLFVPKGFAHGFYTLSERAQVSYKCDALYSPGNEASVLWSDPDLGIDWPDSHPILSDKDRVNPCLKDIAPDKLPGYPG